MKKIKIIKDWDLHEAKKIGLKLNEYSVFKTMERRLQKYPLKTTFAELQKDIFPILSIQSIKKIFSTLKTKHLINYKSYYANNIKRGIVIDSLQQSQSADENEENPSLSTKSKNCTTVSTETVSKGGLSTESVLTVSTETVSISLFSFIYKYIKDEIYLSKERGGAGGDEKIWEYAEEYGRTFSEIHKIARGKISLETLQKKLFPIVMKLENPENGNKKIGPKKFYDFVQWMNQNSFYSTKLVEPLSLSRKKRDTEYAYLEIAWMQYSNLRGQTSPSANDKGVGKATNWKRDERVREAKVWRKHGLEVFVDEQDREEWVSEQENQMINITPDEVKQLQVSRKVLHQPEVIQILPSPHPQCKHCITGENPNPEFGQCERCNEKIRISLANSIDM